MIHVYADTCSLRKQKWKTKQEWIEHYLTFVSTNACFLQPFDADISCTHDGLKHPWKRQCREFQLTRFRPSTSPILQTEGKLGKSWLALQLGWFHLASSSSHPKMSSLLFAVAVYPGHHKTNKNISPTTETPWKRTKQPGGWCCRCVFPSVLGPQGLSAKKSVPNGAGRKLTSWLCCDSSTISSCWIQRCIPKLDHKRFLQ